MTIEASTHLSQRALTVDEWESRLATYERILARLQEDVARAIVAIEDAGDATGLTKRERLTLIHSMHGKLGALDGGARLARRRIEKGLV